MTTPRNAREMLVLGIETSCDETAAAVVARAGPVHGRILSNIVRAQWEQHRRYGGVVPEIAARAHVECLDEIIAQALREAGIGFDSLDGVAATAGPGLVGGLLVGVTTAKALALVHRLPFVAVNHL
jgi:N6-L-threonylcarbamoyladenine synthase